MTRPPRFEFPHTLYHITSHGDRREEFFKMIKVFLDLASTSKISEKFRTDVNSLKDKFSFLASSSLNDYLSPNFTSQVSPATKANTDLLTQVNTVAPNEKVFKVKN